MDITHFNKNISLSLVYKGFQYVALLVFVLVSFPVFRKVFSLSKLFLLYLILFLLPFFASEYLAQWSGQSEGQSYFGYLLSQVFLLYCSALLLRIPHNQKFLLWRSYSLASALLYAVAKIGCHFKGCCWGSLCRFPWAIYYRNPEVTTPWMYLPLHPVQLYSVFHGVLVFFILFKFKSFGISQFLILMGVGRILTESFRGDTEYYHLSWFGYSPNMILSLFCIVLGFSIQYFSRRNK